MRRNPNDRYSTTTNPMVIEDDDTGEQMIFLVDDKNRLVIRSLLEEDIKPFICQYVGLTSKERRDKRRLLYEHISESNSQEYFFCIEKIIGEEDKEDSTSIYGLPREPIGICGRSDEEVTLTEKVDSELGAFLYDFDVDTANCVENMLHIIAEYLKIQKTNVYFVRKPQKVVVR